MCGGRTGRDGKARRTTVRGRASGIRTVPSLSIASSTPCHTCTPHCGEGSMSTFQKIENENQLDSENTTIPTSTLPEQPKNVTFLFWKVQLHPCCIDICITGFLASFSRRSTIAVVAFSEYCSAGTAVFVRSRAPDSTRWALAVPLSAFRRTAMM